MTYMFPSPSDIESLKQANKYIAGLINDQTHDKELIQAQRDLWKAKYKYIRECISGLLATNGGVRFTLTQIEMLIKAVRLHASVDTSKSASKLVEPVELAIDNEADMLEEINREDMLSMRTNTDRLVATGKNAADYEGDEADSNEGGISGYDGEVGADVELGEDIEREAAEELERLMNIDAECANNTAYIKQFKNMFALGVYEPTEQVLTVEREELAHMTTYYKYYEMLTYDIANKRYDQFMSLFKTCNKPTVGSKYLIDMCAGIQDIITGPASSDVGTLYSGVTAFMRCHINKITSAQSNIYANNLNAANRQLSELKTALFAKDTNMYLVDELITNTFDSYSINTSTAEIDTWFNNSGAMMGRWIAGVKDYIAIIDQIVKQLIVVNKNKYIFVKIFKEKAYKKEASATSK